MWSLLPRFYQVFVLVLIGVTGVKAIEAISSLLEGVLPGFYGAASLVASTVVLGLIPIGERIWRPIWRRCPLLNKIVFPDLNGRWEGELRSSWTDELGNPQGPIPVTLWIEQGLFRVNVRMETTQSRSRSTRCLVEADREAGIYRLWFTYDNRPFTSVSDRSPRHEGAAWLELDLNGHAEALVGQYFTDRKTRGDISVAREHN